MVHGSRMLLNVVVVWFSVLCYVDASAIPMWEFLSRDEKMSYLYNTFANQVDTFCEYNDMQNCNKELIKYGLSKLSNMPDDHLDRMDPYQRGAHNIIWGSMMEGHEVMQQKSQPESTTSASKRADAGRPTGVAQSIQDKIGSLDVDDRFVDDPFNNYLNAAASSKYELSVPNGYGGAMMPPVGPMVVRVRPDGTPVDRMLPVDEDLIHFRMSKTKIPSASSVDRFVGALRPHERDARPFAVYVAPRS